MSPCTQHRSTAGSRTDWRVNKPDCHMGHKMLGYLFTAHKLYRDRSNRPLCEKFSTSLENTIANGNGSPSP